MIRQKSMQGKRSAFRGGDGSLMVLIPCRMAAETGICSPRQCLKGIICRLQMTLQEALHLLKNVDAFRILSQI